MVLLSTPTSLDNELKFTDIPYIVEETLKNITSRDADSLTEILEDDLTAREEAERLIALRVKLVK